MEISEILSKLNALDENKKPDDFLVDLEKIVIEDIEKPIIKNNPKHFNCAYCGNYLLGLYGVMKAILTTAHYGKIVCAKCERDNYIEKTHGLPKASNTKYKEAAFAVLNKLN